MAMVMVPCVRRDDSVFRLLAFSDDARHHASTRAVRSLSPCVETSEARSEMVGVRVTVHPNRK